MVGSSLDVLLRQLTGGAERLSLASASDGQLLERFVTCHEEAAFAVLLCRHGPMVLLRILRGMEVLEHIGTPAARHVIASLAEGTPQARLTREAKAALQRLR